MYRRFICLQFLLVLSSAAMSQVQVSGIVTDSGGEPLPAAAIQWWSGYTTTDLDGQFWINVPSDTTILSFSYLGYRGADIPAGEASARPIELSVIDQILEATTITASRYQQRLSDATVSVDILRPQLIAATNTIKVDDVLQKMSGVQVIGGQANIRGGSGFSYGAGSRVMLLVDDMPALQVDAGFTNWGDLPVENIGQIEVVKGAASSLYGSAALNGIINVRTAEASTSPYTKVVTAVNNYRPAGDSIGVWYEDSLRYSYTISAVHRRKIGKLDLVASVFHTRDENYNQSTFENRKRGTLKLRYHLSDRLSIGLNTIAHHGDNGDFLIWQNGQEGALLPLAGTANTQNNLRIFVDPSVRYLDNFGNQHKLLMRHHYIDNENSSNQGNGSKTYYCEYQFSRRMEQLGLDITSGAVGSTTNTSAELFGDTTFTTNVVAAYVQADYEITDRWTMTGGLRYEYNQQITPDTFNMVRVTDGRIEDGRPVARLGSRYRVSEYGTLRSSWGQGYRFPTVTERFISTNFGGFSIAPNPGLVPERGWTAEVGYKQGLSLLGITGYVDFAGFTSHYQEMMEFVAAGDSDFQFTSQNVGQTAIYGAEISVFAQADIGEVSIQAFGGYTFIDPRYRDLDSNDLLRESLSTDQNFLKYRSRHNAKMDLQADYKGFSLGLSANYTSHIVNVDRVFEAVEGIFEGVTFDIIGLQAFRQRYDQGFTKVDVRMSYDTGRYKLSLLADNALNTVYILRPGLLEPPRTIGVRLEMTLED